MKKKLYCLVLACLLLLAGCESRSRQENSGTVEAGGSSATSGGPTMDAPSETRAAEGCATISPNQQVKVAVSNNLVRIATVDTSLEKVVSVFVHVVRKSDGSMDIDNSMIEKQIAVLNDAFANKIGRSTGTRTRFRFELKDVLRIDDDSMHACPYSVDGRISKVETDMKLNRKKDAGRKGDSLNVWIVNTPGDIIGWATWPWDRKNYPDLDGVVIRRDTLPEMPRFSGMTLVHEVGHWLGVYHTHEGACGESGDYVDDTPASKVNYGCKLSDDSCPDAAGQDPVENFMGYAPDTCMNRFSLGQSERMDDCWYLFRR